MGRDGLVTGGYEKSAAQSARSFFRPGGEGAAMGRLIGLDVGEKTIGIAVSDPLGVTAQGVEVWRRGGQARDLSHLTELGARYEAEAFVVGLPRRTDGSFGPEAEAVRAFGRALEAASGRPVHFWDERFTTKEAERVMLLAGARRERRRRVIDMAAAQLILQAYLERRRECGR